MIMRNTDICKSKFKIERYYKYGKNEEQKIYLTCVFQNCNRKDDIHNIGLINENIKIEKIIGKQYNKYNDTVFVLETTINNIKEITNNEKFKYCIFHHRSNGYGYNIFRKKNNNNNYENRQRNYQVNSWIRK